jgi:hypothetical protein
MRRTERRFGRFYRMIALPHGANGEAAQASMQDGVLQIRMPIADLQTRGRSISVQEGHAATQALQQDDAQQAMLQPAQSAQPAQPAQSAQPAQASQPTAAPLQSLH